MRDLPLFRAKSRPIYDHGLSDTVGPGTYFIERAESMWGSSRVCDAAPFLSSSARFGATSVKQRTPGPGEYYGGVTKEDESAARPTPQFFPSVPRFPAALGNKGPGPGAYNLGGDFNTTVTSRPPRRTHTHFMPTPQTVPSIPPADSEFNRDCADNARDRPTGDREMRGKRKNAGRGPAFDRYTTRQSFPGSQDAPGPGWYDVPPSTTGRLGVCPTGLTSTMNSRTERSSLARVDGVPGPGSYDIPTACTSGNGTFARAARDERVRSAADAALPSSFTGRRLPCRRAQSCGMLSPCFLSKTSRFGNPPLATSCTGPGCIYPELGRTEAPSTRKGAFGSSAPRFQYNEAAAREPQCPHAAESLDLPKASRRPLFREQLEAAPPPKAAKPAGYREYDGGGTYVVDRDWSKPVNAMGGDWSRATRFPSGEPSCSDGGPGPGAYHSESTLRHMRNCGTCNSSWPKGVRFNSGHLPDMSPSPLDYYHDCGTVRRTFNVSIGAGYSCT